MTRRRRAREIIATHLGYDMAEMEDYRYQPTRYRTAIYAIGDHYYCAPGKHDRLPSEWRWDNCGAYFGRTVYRAHMNATKEANA